MYVCMYVCMHACMHACMYVCRHMIMRRDIVHCVRAPFRPFSSVRHRGVTDMIIDMRKHACVHCDWQVMESMPSSAHSTSTNDSIDSFAASVPELLQPAWFTQATTTLFHPFER